MKKIGKFYIMNEDEYRTVHNSVYLTRLQTETTVEYSKKLKNEGRENEDRLPRWFRESAEGMYETAKLAEDVLKSCWIGKIIF